MVGAEGGKNTEYSLPEFARLGGQDLCLIN